MPIIHDLDNPLCRPCNGERRNEEKKKLRMTIPEKYLQQCEEAADKRLKAQGNLDGCISNQVTYAMKCEMLNDGDFHKDIMLDLSLMKATEEHLTANKIVIDEPENKHLAIRYVRRITVDPLLVILFHDESFECLRRLSVNGKFITIHIDASGGVVVEYAGRILYYAGVIRDTSQILNQHERRRIIPLFESINGTGAHDAYNISLVLSEFKNQFHVKFPTLKWPIRKSVTDMSYAMLNAICYGWNNCQKLIEYINLTYDAANGDISWKELQEDYVSTLIQICCGHISKNFSKDVDEHFPKLSPQHKDVLKEIFAGFFDECDLNKLKIMYNQTITKTMKMMVMTKST